MSLAELRFGIEKVGSKRLAATLEDLAASILVLPLEEPVDRPYAKIRTHLERIGRPIGPNDLLIAAIALANDLILVTHNTAEFSRVPQLRLEDWQVP